MYSQRFEWDAATHPLSVALQRKRARGEALIDLTDANPTRVGLEYPVTAILGSLMAPEAMVYSPTPQGLPVAREAVSGYYQKIGATIAPSHILLTASTSEAYGLLFKLLADPGDEILIPRPGYPLLSHLAGFEGVSCCSYPLRHDDEKGWTVDLEILDALVTPRTRAVVVVNPNNPTGSYIKEQELATVDALCRRHAMALIVDEVFADYAGRCPAPAVRTASNRTTALTFVLSGFSKILGLPQMKLGWIVCGGSPQQATTAMAHLETLMDFYLSVSTPIQIAATALLAHQDGIQGRIKARIGGNETFLRALVEKTHNIRLLTREGGWYSVLVIDDSIADDTRALELLEVEQTLIHPGLFYDFHREGFVVISLLPAPEHFRTGVRRLIRRYAAPA
jgi:alanine-synthesizing transaminase